MNDMERIQRGLEEFLQREMAEEEYEEDWDRKPVRKRGAGRSVQGRTGRGAGRSAEDRSGRRDRNSAGMDADVREPRSGSRKRPRKKRGGGLLFIRFLLVIFLLGAIWYAIVGIFYNKLNYHEIESVADAPLWDKGVVNILLIGNDSRENGEDGRSDAMILLTICPRNKTLYMTSLLRDMYVEIPGHDNNRLNAAYSFGGAELLMETVEKNLDIRVDRYVQVNFEAFANLVDAVGGVDLELTSAEIEWVNAYLNEYNLLTGKDFGTDYMDTSQEGQVHLNGPQALAYTRNRYIGTDFGRTQRQRKVLSAVMHKLPKAVLHPGELLDGLMPNLTTNLTKQECFGLSLLAPYILACDTEQNSIPAEGTYKDATIRKMAVLEVDFDANIKYLHQLIYEKHPKEVTETEE